MTLTCMGIPAAMFDNPRALIRPSVVGCLLTFPLLGGIILLLTTLFINDPIMRKGFYIMAATPPGVAVVPFTHHLRGNVTLSMAGVTGGYLAALVVMPVAGLIFFGAAVIDPVKLLVVVAELIFIPLLLSRFALKSGVAARLEPVRGIFVNWSFFLVVYTIVGLNRDVFFGEPLSLVPVIAVMIASSFLLGIIVEKIAGLFSTSDETATSMVLLATVKNYGLAGGLALALFEKKAAVPAAVAAVVLIIFLIWLGIRDRRKSD
jgi:BASS family bile acid:Na+ symporter